MIAKSASLAELCVDYFRSAHFLPLFIESHSLKVLALLASVRNVDPMFKLRLLDFYDSCHVITTWTHNNPPSLHFRGSVPTEVQPESIRFVVVIQESCRGPRRGPDPRSFDRAIRPMIPSVQTRIPFHSNQFATSGIPLDIKRICPKGFSLFLGHPQTIHTIAIGHSPVAAFRANPDACVVLVHQPGLSWPAIMIEVQIVFNSSGDDRVCFIDCSEPVIKSADPVFALWCAQVSHVVLSPKLSLRVIHDSEVAPIPTETPQQFARVSVDFCNLRHSPH
mmetsp:Transcript_4034/g.10294  ORF Transcript_4034/g.10294 Transcript_4034/m.10294 type:complete len:278 (-) Transcript_4034:1565-2398(-)